MTGQTRPLILVLLYLLLVLFHAAVVWDQKSPDVDPDEIAYLAQASYFAGAEPLPRREGWRYYHFGYSLLITPAYWLTDSPSSAYQAVLVLNSFLLSTLFLILVAWIRALGDLPFRTTVAIAFIVSLYPPYVLHANIGWAENAFIPGFALSCLLYTRYLKARRLGMLLLFTLVAGSLYTIHPRGLVVAIAALVCLTGLALARDEARWHAGIGIVVIATVLAATKLVASDLSAMMNAAPHGPAFARKLTSMFDFMLMPTLLGQLMYMSLATVGLFLLGATETASRILEFRSRGVRSAMWDPGPGSMVYIALASALSFGVSVVFLAKAKEPLLDSLIYGRYNEGFLSVYIALGLVWLHRISSRHPQRYAARLNAGFWVLAAAAFAYSLFLAKFTGIRSSQVYGLFPWRSLSLHVEGWLGIAPMIIGPLLWTWLILKLFLRNETKGMVAVGAYFLLLDISLFIYITPGLQIIG